MFLFLWLALALTSYAIPATVSSELPACSPHGKERGHHGPGVGGHHPCKKTVTSNPVSMRSGGHSSDSNPAHTGTTCEPGVRIPMKSRPSGAYLVDPKYKTDPASKVYATIDGALNAIHVANQDAVLFIAAGTYNVLQTLHLLNLDARKIEIYGQTENMCNPSLNQVVITTDLHYIQDNQNKELTKISGLYIEGNNTSIYNLNITNTGGLHHAAVGLSTKGDNNNFYSCCLESIQDVWYTYTGQAMFLNGIITGMADVVFTKYANVIITNSVMFLPKSDRQQAHLLVQGREKPDQNGAIILDHSKIMLDPQVQWRTHKLAFGRDWKQYARSYVQFVEIDGDFNSWNPKGFEPWTQNDKQEHVSYGYYKVTGTGSYKTYDAPMIELEKPKKFSEFLPSTYYAGLDQRFVDWADGDR